MPKLILAILMSFITFIVTVKISNFFIPPRDHWRKSKWDILLVRYGMALTAAGYVFAAIVGLL